MFSVKEKEEAGWDVEMSKVVNEDGEQEGRNFLGIFSFIFSKDVHTLKWEDVGKQTKIKQTRVQMIAQNINIIIYCSYILLDIT